MIVCGEGIRDCCWVRFVELAKASAWVAATGDRLSYQLRRCFALHSLHMTLNLSVTLSTLPSCHLSAVYSTWAHW
jgi:hypothetical protein